MLLAEWADIRIAGAGSLRISGFSSQTFFSIACCLFEVCRIRDGKYLIDAAGLFFGVVHDFACRELSVRYEDDFVVDRAYFCVADENILDGALISARRYIVVVAERAGYQHENAARQSSTECR